MTTSIMRRGLLAPLLALAALPGCLDSDSGPEAELNQWQRVGPFSVVVRSVASRQLTGNGILGAGYSREPVCVITIGLRVDEPNKEIQYVSPSSASLRDGEGRSYRTVDFVGGVTLNEQASANKVLRSGESVADILLFDKEAAKARSLHLRWGLVWKEKEGGSWKEKSGGTARFKIER